MQWSHRIRVGQCQKLPPPPNRVSPKLIKTIKIYAAGKFPGSYLESPCFGGGYVGLKRHGQVYISIFQKIENVLMENRLQSPPLKAHVFSKISTVENHTIIFHVSIISLHFPLNSLLEIHPPPPQQEEEEEQQQQQNPTSHTFPQPLL